MKTAELKPLSKELSKFCKDNNIPEGKAGLLMGLFVKHSPALERLQQPMSAEEVMKLAKEESEYLADYEDKPLYERGFIDGYKSASPQEPQQQKAYWYCPECKIEVDGSNVTSQELHDKCGTAVQQKGESNE